MLLLSSGHLPRAEMKLMARAILAMSMIAGTAQAGDWRAVVIDNEVGMLVDTSTIRNLPYGKKKVAWVARLFPATNEHGTDYTLAQTEFDCSMMTTALLSFHLYSADERVIDSATSRRPAEPVVPDTRGHAVYKAVCEGTDNPASDTVAEALEIYREVITGEN